MEGYLKKLFGFSFSEFGVLAKIECSSMANVKSVPVSGGWGARHSLQVFTAVRLRLLKILQCLVFTS